MAKFEAWDRANLVAFVVEANRRMQDQESQLAVLRQENERLEEDLRVALDAYRRLIVRSDVADATVAT